MEKRRITRREKSTKRLFHPIIDSGPLSGKLFFPSEKEFSGDFLVFLTLGLIFFVLLYEEVLDGTLPSAYHSYAEDK